MLSYKELVELREKLSKEEITLNNAVEFYKKNYEKGKRSWHTTDWREKRKEIIKDKCEICGSTKTLTIQHRSHPRKYHECLKEVKNKYTEYFIISDMPIDKCEFFEYILKDYDYNPIPLCPECKSKNPNKRMRKKPQYLCRNCHLEFDEPVNKTADEIIDIFYLDYDASECHDKCFVSKDKWNKKQNLRQIKYKIQREKVENNSSEKIEKEAFLLYLDDNIKYLSLEDTITACRKCAFNCDMKKLELCPKCKNYYKGIQYPTCIQCLPEDKRKIALEKIEAGKEWHAMHKALGIDLII